jgi:hypothetical protein
MSITVAVNRLSAGPSTTLAINYSGARESLNVNRHEVFDAVCPFRTLPASRGRQKRVSVSVGRKLAASDRTELQMQDATDRKKQRDRRYRGTIVSRHKLRAGWAAAFRRMGKAGDDELLIPDDLRNAFDDVEWRW